MGRVAQWGFMETSRRMASAVAMAHATTRVGLARLRITASRH